jgi:hypothetical protein
MHQQITKLVFFPFLVSLIQQPFFPWQLRDLELGFDPSQTDMSLITIKTADM